MSRLSFNNIDYLETGTHKVSFMTIKNELNFSLRRKELLFNLKQFLEKYHCEADLIDSIFIIGSFASKKNNPSDMDLAIKLNEENINSNTRNSSLFDAKQLKSKFKIQVVFIELENKSLKKYVPEKTFFNEKLNHFRSLKEEERKVIDYQKWNPEFDLDKKAKGILELALNDFCK